MTYQEIKDRLTKCESTLTSLKAQTIQTKAVENKIKTLSLVKESLHNKLNLLEGTAKTYLVTPKQGQTTAVSLGDDERDALKDADDVKAIKGVDGEEIKEEVGDFTVDQTKAIAKQVGAAVAKALKVGGEEVASMKGKNIEENSFDIYVQYKNNSDDSFSFHIEKDKLILADFSFSKVMGEVGIKPSGEAIVMVDVIADNLNTHFKSLNTVGEQSEDQSFFIEVSVRTARKALDILNDMFRGQYETEGSNYYVFKDEQDGYDAGLEMASQGIELEDTNIEGLEEAAIFDGDDEAAETDFMARRRETNDYNEQLVKETCKVGDILTKDGKKGKVIKHSETQATVDFGNGDVYGIAHSRIKDGKILKEEEKVNEAPYQTTYIKVAKSDYKKAMAILDPNLDSTYVKTDIVDDDGDGNVIIYFNFRSSDDGEPDEDVGAFIYDVAMDLQANGINPTSASHDIEEATDINDPVLMKLRAQRSSKKASPNRETGTSPKKKAIIDKLKAKRAQVMRDMEQEAEPQGGPIADKYGDILNKIDSAIAKASGRKQMSYDDAIGEGNEKEIKGQELVDYIMGNWNWSEEKTLHWLANNFGKAKKQEGPKEEDQRYIDYLRRSGRDEYADKLVALNPDSLKEDDKFAGQDPKAGSTIQGTGYNWPMSDATRARKEADKAKDKEESNEDIDVGHQDDEPNMLVKDIYDIATYAAKLHKRLKKYDQHDGEVDFPQWWQKKIILARDYISSASHYLEGEENQPALDQLALENKVNEGRGDLDQIVRVITDMANEDGTSTKEAALEIIDAIKDAYQIHEEGVEENVDKVAGGIPYRQHGNKVIISEPLDDATKERLLAKAKEYGYFAQPNMAGGITITLKRGMHKEANNLGEKKRPGLWANINAKKKRGEKASHGNSNAHKDAVAAGNAMKKEGDIDKMPHKLLKEYGSNDIDELTGAIGYRHLDHFFEDNPGATQALQEWLMDIPEFEKRIEDAFEEDHRPSISSLIDAIGYDDFDQFFDDNPGGVETIADWILSIPDFVKKLANEFTTDELENFGLHDVDGYDSEDNEDDLDEGVAKTQKAYNKVVTIMKDLAKQYKAGDKSVVDQLKTLTITKKKLEAMLDKDVAGIGANQQLDTTGLDEDKATYCGRCGTTHKKSSGCPK
tara:strand:+ start:693 stop:4139 length:3447 start_codon:yes stop_codon:yes gene_type:complete